MTIRAQNRAIIAGLVIGVAAVAVTLLPMLASPGGEDPIRDIHVVVRNMAFYVDGQAEANPVITVRAGEQVRIRLRNDEAGVGNDFAIKACGVGTQVLNDSLQEDTVTFRVPRDKGTQAYLCTPHSEMMRGTIRVE